MPYTGYDPENEPVDAVRFLVGDMTEPFRLSDTEILFALNLNANTYAAAAICARALAAQYARRVDSRFETIDNKYSQLHANYEKLARRLDAQAKRAGGLGLPLAGGITKTDVDAARADSERVPAFFHDNLFINPPPSNE